MTNLAQSFFTEITIPQQKLFDEKSLCPSVLSPSTDADLSVLMAKIKEDKKWLESVLKESGAILLRGFPVKTASEFNDVLEAFGYDEHKYVGGIATKSHVVGRVFTANEAPPSYEISFHHEMAYLLEFPTKLFFFCEVEPQKDGETPFVLSHIVYEKIEDKYPDFVDQLEKKGLVYITYQADEFDTTTPYGRGWKFSFATNDKSVAEERAAKVGLKLEWQENGVNAIRGPIPAIKVDESRNRKIWFNHLVAAYVARKDPKIIQDITYGDGTKIPDQIIEECLKIMEEESVVIPWQKGDILLLDNLAVLHARRTFDPPRRILVSLCNTLIQGHISLSSDEI